MAEVNDRPRGRRWHEVWRPYEPSLRASRVGLMFNVCAAIKRLENGMGSPTCTFQLIGPRDRRSCLSSGVGRVGRDNGTWNPYCRSRVTTWASGKFPHAAVAKICE